MRRFPFIIMVLSVLSGIAIAAKSEPSGPSIKKQDTNGVAIVAESEPNSPSTKKQDAKQLITSLARNHQHSLVIEEGTKQLLRTDLKSDEEAYIRLKMAKSFEALPSQGRLAKEKYGEILELHPEYHQNVKVAYRLAELNDGITLDGTTPNTQQAIDCYRYVIKHGPEHGIQYETLKAHRGLGCLCLDQHEYEEARKHFEAIYNCEPGMLRIVPDEDLKHPEDIARNKAWVLERLESMKADMPQNIVNTCIRSNPEESLKALQTLMKTYASDPKITTIARSVYVQEVARKDSMMKMMSDNKD
jgi:tetratricopeptide (TPR) repeat protein